jgi:primosomal protein N' (replication factor Y)
VLYHARDMAVLRASIEQAAIVLVSATPSLESWVNAETGKYARVDLTERFGPAVPPTLRAVDLREDPPARGTWLSPALRTAMTSRLGAGEQSLLFLNRRGYAPVIVCQGCGHRFGCPHCEAHLVEHRFRSRLMCHQCGYTAPIPNECPSCNRTDRLASCGPGVERVAEEAAGLFPNARIAILSSDIAESASAQRERIAAIARGEADIIIGTQMVAKGHNFPLLTLVGVVDADLGLQGADLRAAEKTFQLIRQVAGRAGRADRPGEALLQTIAPQHPVIQAILSGDEETFWRREAAQRQGAASPPFGRMAAVILSGPDEPATFRAAREMAQNSAALHELGADLFGPAPAPIARIRGRSRVRMLVKATKGAPLSAALKRWRDTTKIPSAIRIAIDVDPHSFL